LISSIKIIFFLNGFFSFFELLGKALPKDFCFFELLGKALPKDFGFFELLGKALPKDFGFFDVFHIFGKLFKKSLSIKK